MGKSKIIGMGVDLGHNPDSAIVKANPEVQRYLNAVAPATLNITYDTFENQAVVKISEYPCSVRKTIPLNTAVLMSEADEFVMYLEDMRKELDKLLITEKSKVYTDLGGNAGLKK